MMSSKWTESVIVDSSTMPGLVLAGCLGDSGVRIAYISGSLGFLHVAYAAQHRNTRAAYIQS